MVKKCAFLNTRKEEILYAIFYTYSAIPGTISSFLFRGERSEAVILLTGIRDQETKPDSGLFWVQGDRVPGGGDNRWRSYLYQGRDESPPFSMYVFPSLFLFFNG